MCIRDSIYSLAVNFLFKGIGTHWTITLDDVTTEGDWSLVSVCNGRYYGGGFMPVAEARMDDGVLNTLVAVSYTHLDVYKRQAMRILIVEDEKRLAGTLQDLLRRPGYTADVCSDGISGLDNARSDRCV